MTAFPTEHSDMELDWDKCIICQQKTGEPLKCPLQGPGTLENKTEAYGSFLANVEQFQAIESLPTKIYFENETATSFTAHSASWHKSCHLKYNNSKLKKATKRKSCMDEVEPERRTSKRQAIDNTNVCLFCLSGTEEGDLHQILTFDADKNIRTMISELQDTTLLSRIDGGDLIAKESKYHLKCLVSLRNSYRSHIRKSSPQHQNIDERLNESRAFVELTNYIEKAVDSGTLLFKLSELHALYANRLKDLGITKLVNKTRLKVSLLQHFSEAQEQCDGKNTIIVFKEGMENMLKEVLKKRDFSEDAMTLAKAAVIVRNDIFNHHCSNFSGAFLPNCQEDFLPSSLKSLVSLILNGPNLKDQDTHETQACLTAAQVILYNVKKKSSCKNDVKTRHTLQREPPIPIYIGLNIHQLTRSKKLVDQLYQMGISISYDRVMQLEEWIATSVCEQFERDGVVAPTGLQKGLFTVCAQDNIDHNPSSTTAVNAFHGTGITLFQFPTKANPGECRPPVAIPPSGTKQHFLPDHYAMVPAVALTASAVDVPVHPNSHAEPLQSHLCEAQSKEKCWSEHALTLVEKEELTSEDSLVWAAYHALQQSLTEDPPALCMLLPLFYEKAATPAMVKHGMNVQKQAIEYLNPGQIPVTTFDQPLFALAKLVQWKWPATHGESVHVVMLGGLHIEMALWSTLGDVLEGSGWTSALIESEVASSGTADSFLKVSHLARTRHAHQVTVLTLWKLRKVAYLQSGTNQSEAAWIDDMQKRSPTFMYWDFILRYETLILIFVRAHREKDFALYVEVLEELTPLFFALDHVNYARWLPIHIKDMKCLPSSIRDEFEKQCHWVLSKTNNKFSAIPVDQAHEQENAYIKGRGGCIGLTENPTAFSRWMLSGPELARLQKQFEEQYLSGVDPEHPRNLQNHEQGLAAQKTFQTQVNSLFNTFIKMSNPFLDDFPELVTLDSRNCVDNSVVIALRALEDIGVTQYHDFVKRVIEDRSVSIHQPIKKNSLALFKRPQPKVLSKQGKKFKVLQNNVALFGQLFVSMQSREGDLKEFFAHEIQSFPPSLSDLGKLHLTSAKSDLLKCIGQPELSDPPSTYECTVLDGAVIVHFLPTNLVNTFEEYADKVFIPYLFKQLEDSIRLDLVWDIYLPNSLKESTREKRGKGVRRKVSGQTKLPGNWPDFLRDENNKRELFSFLTSKVAKSIFPPNKAVYVTSGESVISVGQTSSIMSDCNHEEADTRVVVHILHALEQGMKTFVIRTVDTDVIVILAGVFFELIAGNPLADIWVAFGIGKNFRMYSINAICSYLGEEKAQALPLFHALTGCDTTSAFRGKGKKSAWQAWQAYEEVTGTLRFLATHPFEQFDTNSEHFQRIERLVVVLYSKTCPLISVNSAREELFCRKNRKMDMIPPTQDALQQHVKRAVYQAGIWMTSTQIKQVVPSPDGFGWSKDPLSQLWVPIWITIPEVSKACSELIKCSCKGDCTTCKCGKANLVCSPLCNCKCNHERNGNEQNAC